MTPPASQDRNVDRAPGIPAHKPKDVESALDEALDESFPASDPPAILIA